MNPLTVEVMRTGQFTTIQDGGREGYRQFGIPSSGAMDRSSMQWANYLVGNPLDAPVLEFTFFGGCFRFNNSATIGFVGAPMELTLNGEPMESHQTQVIPAGGELKIGRAKEGCRAYLAIAGEYQGITSFGSFSTYTLGEFGGHQGRPLKAGDKLTWEAELVEIQRKVPEHLRHTFHQRQLLRVLIGPEWNLFSETYRNNFLKSIFSISTQSNRMGIRLRSESANGEHQLGPMNSGPTFPGTVQMPAGGSPIVLMADGQTTGGYPRIAQLIEADLGRLAQMTPGEKLSFVLVSMAEALKLNRHALQKELK